MNRYPRRTTAERLAEAAVYRSRTEESQKSGGKHGVYTPATNMVKINGEWEDKPEIPIIPLKFCEYDKASKVLKLASEYFGMPNEFFVESHVTGKMVRFTVVNEHDILFDQDGWDGEMTVYRPVGNVPTVDHMYIYNAY